MIQNTFIHIQGIGRKTEERLWERGIFTWQDFVAQKRTVFSSSRDASVRRAIQESMAHLDDIRFFNERLSRAECWRLFEDFRDKAAFLDIETTGGYGGSDEITMVGVYDGKKTRTFVNGRNLQDFEIAIADYDLLVTFNGSCFDIPHIERWFRGITLPPAHIDLRFVLRRLGITGGLKRVEKALGILRRPEINGLNGYDAVLLWRDYQWGDPRALERLTEYNRADIENLEPLMAWAYSEMKRRLLGDDRSRDAKGAPGD